MFRFDHRPAFAAAAVAVAALAVSVVAQGFLPADPHVEIARAQALLDRAERVQDAQAASRPVKIAQVAVLIH